MSHRALGGDGQDLAARAADPSTSQTELHQLAADRPDLRPLIAENPNTYPQLLQWLGSLNDAEIDAALGRRDGGSTGSLPAAEEPTRPLGSEDHSQQTRALPPVAPGSARTPPEPTEEFGAVRQPPSEPEPTSAFDRHVYGTDAAPAGPSYPAGPPQSHGFGYGQPHAYAQPPYTGHPHDYAPSTPIYDQPQEHRRPPRRSRGGGCAIVLLLALLTAAALAASYFLLFGSPLGGKEDDSAPTEQQEDIPPAEEETGQDAPEESPSPAQEDEEEADDDEPARPAPQDALGITSFSAPSDNIHCVLGEEDVTCTIDEYFFDAPEDCDEAVTVRVGREGSAQTACGENLSSQGENLDYGQSTGNEDFVCEATETHFECWSQQTGNGFQLAREYYSLYDY